MSQASSVKTQGTSWLFILALLWVLAVLLVFLRQCPEAWLSFHFSIPLGNAGLSQLISTWLELFSMASASLWCFFLMLWTGRKVLRLLGPLNLSAVLTLCFEAGVGLFVWQLFWLGTGLVRLWFPLVWLSAICATTLCAIPDLLLWAKTAHQLRLPKMPIWVWPFVLVYGLLGFFNALTPETFYDSLNYFLGMPQFWVNLHGLANDPYHVYSGFFLSGSMCFMGGWVMGHTEGATLLSVSAWALCGVLAYGWAEELAGKRAAWMAFLAVLTLPLLYLNAWAIRVDDLFAFVAILFVYGVTRLLEERDAPKKPWFLLTALFAGVAVAIKPTALIMLVAVFLVLVVRREKGWMDRWVPLGLLSLLLGFLSVGPWMIKNWVFMGNPFYPYASDLMGGLPVWEPGHHRLLHENQRFLSMDQGFWSYLTLPWRLVMPDDGDDQMIGPLLLAFLPTLFLFKLKGTKQFLFWVTLAALGLGFASSHMLRFSMAAFLLATLLIAVVMDQEDSPGYLRRTWQIAVGVFAVFFLGAYAVISAQYYQPWLRWTAQESRHEYLERMISNSYEEMSLWTDENLPQDCRLLVVGDARGLFYKRQFIANSVHDEPFFAKAARQETDTEGILKRLKKAGVDYVVINGPEGLRNSREYGQYELTQNQWAKLNRLMAEGLKPLYWKNFQGIYLVKDHLSPEKGSMPPNLFSFLCPSAYDYSKAMEKGDKAQAQSALKTLLLSFPNEAYWRDLIQHPR